MEVFSSLINPPSLESCPERIFILLFVSWFLMGLLLWLSASGRVRRPCTVRVFHFPLLICWSIIGEGAFRWSFATRSPARFPFQFLLLRYLIHGFLFARPFAFTRINVVILLWNKPRFCCIFVSQTESCFRWQNEQHYSTILVWIIYFAKVARF